MRLHGSEQDKVVKKPEKNPKLYSLFDLHHPRSSVAIFLSFTAFAVGRNLKFSKALRCRLDLNDLRTAAGKIIPGIG